MNMPFIIQNLFNGKAVTDISKIGPTAPGKNGEAGVFAALMGQVQNSGEKDVPRRLQLPSVGAKGHALIAQLKKNLQSLGVSPDQLTADDSALAAIEKVLIGAGFEARQVINLIGELKMNAGGKGVKVSTLFEGISRLTEPSVAKSKPAYLEISALPHIETLLAQFGLTPDQIKTAFGSAKVEGKGIDAGRLASELKSQGQGLASKKRFVADDNELAEIISLMQQIGLTVRMNRSGKFDLEDFVVALQKFAGQDSNLLSEKGAFSSKDVTSVITDANKNGQSDLNQLKQILGFSISAMGGRLSLDRVAADLEMAAGQQGSTASHQGLAGDWDLFVRNLQAVSPRNGKTSELRLGGLAPGNASSDALLAGMDTSVHPSEISNSLFSNPSFLQPTSGKRGLVEKGSNSQSKPGQTAVQTFVGSADVIKDVSSHETKGETTYSTPLRSVFGKGDFAEKGENSQSGNAIKPALATAGSPDVPKAGWTDALKAGVGAETGLEAAVVAAVAKTGEQGVDAMVKPGRAVIKSNDFSVPLFGDGVTRRTATAESVAFSTPQQPAGRMFPYYLLDQVSRQILRSRLNNESEIMIQLKPPSLGRLKMSIENTTEGLKVSIITENQAARDMLLSNSGDLKAALMDQGLRLDKINVETQADFQQTMADTRHGSEGSEGRKRFSGSSRIRVETDTSEIEIAKVSSNDVNALNLMV